MKRAAKKALKAFFQAMDGTASHQRAELALTLHMLEGVAPKFFAEEQLAAPLKAALEGLKKVPATFPPSIDSDEAMARLDALYLRKVRGLEPRAFKPEAVKAAVLASGRQSGELYGWLMGELAFPLGVEARVPLSQRWPFRDERVIHLYHLTHIVLIDTRYLMTPVPEALVDELSELNGAMEELAAQRFWDLLGECVFCLARAGTPAPHAVEALLAAQGPEGGFAEADASPRSAAHCTAVGVLALAGALDLERSAP